MDVPDPNDGIPDPKHYERSERHIIYGINAIGAFIHPEIVAKGFWDGDPAPKLDTLPDSARERATDLHRRVAEYDIHKMGLVVTEIAEAMEAIRKPEEENAKSKLAHLGFTAVEEELADAVIRIADYAQRRGLRLGLAIVEKNRVNNARPPMHGKLA